MQTVTRIIRLGSFYAAALVLAVGYPLSVFAEEVPAASPTPTATQQTEKPTSPPKKPKPTYTYNAATGRWDSDKWVYDASSNSYKPAPQNPAPVEAPAPTPSAPTVVTPPATDQSTPTAQSNASSTTDATTSTSATNTQDSSATTGNATVNRNTSAGSATTGNATSTATILNTVNSAITTAENQKAATFVSDVMGDVHGDIVLQPMMLKAMLEAGAAANTTITNTSSLTNNVNLTATSGNAAVTNNTKAGSATSGSANTVANVMNIINSMVAANQSFVGTVNIYGSLDGDILIAPDFIPQMLANNKTATAQSAPATISSTDTQSIVNNVALAAKSGQALVTGNTSAGSATSGDANTNVVIFNLSGHEVVASNSLLVFVNVLGKWVGVIVDAPSGATAAAIGNGVSSSIHTPDLNVQVQNAAAITNNVTLASQSGDATVAGNTLADGATTGNATASANIANISNSSFGLSGWFGILFINVFGSWHGSFGIDTAAGTRPEPVASDGGDGARRTPAKRTLKVVDFIPHPVSPAYRQVVQPVTVVTPTATVQHDENGAVLASTAMGTPVATSLSGGNEASGQTPASDFRLPVLIGSSFLMAVSLAALKRLLLHKEHGQML